MLFGFGGFAEYAAAMVMVVDDISTNSKNESKDDECSHGLLGGLMDGLMDGWIDGVVLV